MEKDALEHPLHEVSVGSEVLACLACMRYITRRLPARVNTLYLRLTTAFIDSSSLCPSSICSCM